MQVVTTPESGKLSSESGVTVCKQAPITLTGQLILKFHGNIDDRVKVPLINGQSCKTNLTVCLEKENS